MEAFKSRRERKRAEKEAQRQQVIANLKTLRTQGNQSRDIKAEQEAQRQKAISVLQSMRNQNNVKKEAAQLTGASNISARAKANYIGNTIILIVIYLSIFILFAVIFGVAIAETSRPMPIIVTAAIILVGLLIKFWRDASKVNDNASAEQKYQSDNTYSLDDKEAARKENARLDAQNALGKEVALTDKTVDVFYDVNFFRQGTSRFGYWYVSGYELILQKISDLVPEADENGNIADVYADLTINKQANFRSAISKTCGRIENEYKNICKCAKDGEQYVNDLLDLKDDIDELVNGVSKGSHNFDENTIAFAAESLYQLSLKFTSPLAKSLRFTPPTCEELIQQKRCHASKESGIIINADDIDSMEGHEFEHWCAELLRKNGFSNIEVTQGSGDQGVDITADKDSIKYAIQCKCYSSNLGNTPVQEVCAGKYMYGCHVGVVMTNRYFTPGAHELAKATGVLLWDRDKIMEMIEQS